MANKLDKGSGDAKPAVDGVAPAFPPKQEEKRPPCQEGCPNCGDIRGWIGVVAQREKIGISREEAFARAWRTITDVNPFPSVLGRICPHPCEDHCNRSHLDEPLAINAMERFLGDWAIEQDLPLSCLPGEAGDEWIGVVGAGPSGLSFAYQMARRGYRVTVYDTHPEAGGMLRYGVPDFRLPQATLDAEIARIEDLGVEFVLDTAVGRDIALEELRERHPVLYLGLGAQKGRGLRIPGEAGPSVWTGIEYLSRVNCGEEVSLGGRVVVVGGGNTAIDAARAARRTGAAVTILYRRSREEMPAADEEVQDALEEGIELVLLAAPVRLERSEDGALSGLVACRMALGDSDASGRRRSEPVADSEFVMPLESLITAVSQAPALAGFESLAHEGDWIVTDGAGVVEKGVLAGGDALSLGIAGNAIVQGRSAAEALHARLRGDDADAPAVDARDLIGPEEVRLDHKPATPAGKPDKRTGEARLAEAGLEDRATMSEDQFLREIERCFSCGACMGCEHCFMFCTAACYSRLEEVGPGMYFALALDACKECGKCIEVCPTGYVSAATY